MGEWLPVEACVCSAVLVGNVTLKNGSKPKGLEENLGTNPSTRAF